MDTLTLIRPADWHIHLRDGDALARTVPDAARYFGRVICMPNLVPPVKTVADAHAYRERIMQHAQDVAHFDPRMVLYLTDAMSPNEIQRIADSPYVNAVKLYPAGATTNSDNGVSKIDAIYPVLEQMEASGVPLLVHGEVTHQHVDIFDREKQFLDEVLAPLLQRFPTLKLVLEHITTSDAAQFVLSQGANVAATITPQHLLFNRNHMLVGGIRPHFFCLPILKRQNHQHALIEAATSGNPKFFLGSDSAPHAQSKKEAACGCAGCYSAPFALELYAQAFDEAGRLDQLENFASRFGAEFYGLALNTDMITLKKQTQRIPNQLPYFTNDPIIPLQAGAELTWSVI